MLRVGRRDPVSTMGELSELRASVHRSLPRRGLSPAPGISYVEVAELKELPGTYVLLFNGSRFMNSALDRASLYIEKGELLSDAQVVAGEEDSGGHNLRAEDVLQFWDKYQAQKEPAGPSSSEDAAYLQIEQDLWHNVILPLARENPNAVFLAASVDGGAGEVLTHELVHAQYVTQPEFRDVVEQFWHEQVSEEDKADVRDALSASYDVSNEELVMNEFQAYLLQRGNEDRELKAFVAKYEQPLRDALAARGVAVVQTDV
jgi:hypothetical protein